MDWNSLPSGKQNHTKHIGVDRMPAPAAGIFDSPAACLTINLEWVSFVLARLEILTDKRAWLGNETEQIRASHEIERLLAAMEECPDPPECPECPDPPECDPPSLRQNGNCIEWLNPATSAWECQLIISVPQGGCEDCYECDDCEECDECEDW